MKIKTIKNIEKMKAEYLKELNKIQESSMKQFEKDINDLRGRILNKLIDSQTKE